MAASGDIVARDGDPGNIKLNPYLVTFVRWCISYLWSTATVVIHRMVAAPLPQVAAAPKLASKPSPKPRAAGTDHLHPEPRVECVVLHQPPAPTLDVIFVHGLYGSLGNTWRQGDWKSKYKLNLNTVPLRKHGPNACCCRNGKTDDHENVYCNENKCDSDEDVTFETKTKEEVAFESVNGRSRKVLPQDNALITERFYDGSLLSRVEIIDNYETQAKFVQDLFKNESRHVECESNESVETDECVCRTNDRVCEVGCGCVCDQCYSMCWPKDWIKMDFPGARVISINYTSDPYLWRPLWVKGNKRLRLHERADQMIQQLVGMGVGENPIVWVGHSKGGLFIKQIYCEAFEAHVKINNPNSSQNQNAEDINCDEFNAENKINHMNDAANNAKNVDTSTEKTEDLNTDNEEKLIQNQYTYATLESEEILRELNENKNCERTFIPNIGSKLDVSERANTDNVNQYTQNNIYPETGLSDNIITNISKNLYYNPPVKENYEITGFKSCDDLDNISEERHRSCDAELMIDGDEGVSSNVEEHGLRVKANLWSNSRGFMFYSVPHRGSPLADFKTPITARSVELLEISKDCSLVLSLHERWLSATASSKPAVRSLVETCRTLMSVLWLRIVSVDSADAGIGTLSGVSVDHREICKPSSRSCLLYQELTQLIRTALNKCECQ